MAADLAKITASIRGLKQKAGNVRMTTPIVVNAYGARAILRTRDPYESASINEKPISLLRMDLAHCLQEVQSAFMEEGRLRAAFLHIDALEPHPQDLLWRADQVRILANAMGVSEKQLLEVAARERLISTHRDLTPPAVLKEVKASLREAHRVAGLPKEKQIKEILTAKSEELSRTLHNIRKTFGYRIGHACMRVGSGGPTDLLHRVILNTKIGYVFTQALDVVWGDVAWVMPTEVYVPGAKGEDYMRYLWLRLYATGIYSMFAFQDSGSIRAYWGLRQGKEYRGGLEIPQEYLSPEQRILAPLDPEKGSVGLKQEFNLGLKYLGVKDHIPIPEVFKDFPIQRIPDFEMVMLDAAEMPEAPFSQQQATYT